jgi:LacI family transcriptional regulator
MAIRLKDIAALLDLSVSTVSAAIQSREDISPATRERVLKTVAELGYRPNSLARGLVTRRTQIIGVIVPDLSRSFFTEVLRGIDYATSAADYTLLVCNTEENQAREDRMLSTLLSQHVDGLIIASAYKPPAKKVWSNLAKSKIPFVLVDRHFPHTNFVGGDDEMIGFMATSHLAEQGFRRIAHIGGPHSVSTAIGRLRGYQRALAKIRLPARTAYVIESNYHEESGGYESMQNLLALRTPPDAVFAASDPIAIGALQAALEAGLELPRQFGLIGVGNHRYGAYLKIPLSTMDQKRAEIGQRAARLLLELIQRNSLSRPQSILVEPKLIVRQSTDRGVHSVSLTDGVPTHPPRRGDGVL